MGHPCRYNSVCHQFIQNLHQKPLAWLKSYHAKLVPICRLKLFPCQKQDNDNNHQETVKLNSFKEIHEKKCVC